MTDFDHRYKSRNRRDADTKAAAALAAERGATITELRATVAALRERLTLLEGTGTEVQPHQSIHNAAVEQEATIAELRSNIAERDARIALLEEKTTQLEDAQLEKAQLCVHSHQFAHGAMSPCSDAEFHAESTWRPPVARECQVLMAENDESIEKVIDILSCLLTKS